MAAYGRTRVDHVYPLGRNLSAMDVARFFSQLRPSRQTRKVKRVNQGKNSDYSGTKAFGRRRWPEWGRKVWQVRGCIPPRTRENWVRQESWDEYLPKWKHSLWWNPRHFFPTLEFENFKLLWQRWPRGRKCRHSNPAIDLAGRKRLSNPYLQRAKS